MESYLKPSEVAKQLRISLNTVHRLIDSGKLPAVVIGSQKRVEVDGFDRFIKDNSTAPVANGNN